MTRKSLSYTVAICFLAVAMGVEASGATVFFDDFSDGSATNNTPLDRNGSPVIWTPLAGFNQGTGVASSGDYVLTTTSDDGAFASLTSHMPLSDTSVRAQMRLLNGTAAIAVFARADMAALTAYQAGINTVTGNAYIVRNTPTPIPLIVKPAGVDVMSGDVAIQFDAIGETLRLFVWNPGTPKPTQPFIEIQDGTLGTGVTGVLLDSGGGSGSGVFRFVHVADASIPEPQTALLFAFGMASLVARQRTRAKRTSEARLD